jgi:hypothetical protein
VVFVGFPAVLGVSLDVLGSKLGFGTSDDGFPLTAKLGLVFADSGRSVTALSPGKFKPLKGPKLKKI